MSRRIAAVIVHHGEPSLAERALESVSRSRGVEALAVVVDHGPGPGDSLERVARSAGALYLRPEANLGFAGGLNRGILEACSRGGADLGTHLFLLLNHDVRLDPEAASFLARRFEAEPALGVLGPALLDERDPARVWNAGSEIEWPRGRPRSLFHGRPAGDLPRDPYSVGFVCGCAAAVRGTLLVRIGPLSEEYFLYFEDAELSFRARRAGFLVEVEPRSRAFHLPGSAAAGSPRLASYCRARNRILFSRRWAPPGLGPRLHRLRFALTRLVRGGAEGRGALAGLLGKSGPPPALAK